MLDSESIIDGVVIVNEDLTEEITCNFYSWVFLIKEVMKKYTKKQDEEAKRLILSSPIVQGANSSFMAAVVRAHETEYHWAMEIVYGEQYWLKGIDSQEPDGYFEWEDEVREKNKLAEDCFILNN